MSTIAIYARISEDRDGEAAGVNRQLPDCREFAERRGWDIAQEFIDNDMSGYSGKTRPGFEAMIAAWRAGEFDGIVCWKADRLTRNLREWVTVRDALKARPGAFFATAMDGTEVNAEGGHLTADIRAAVAEEESRGMSDRIRRKMRERREQGLPHGGGRRHFGYNTTKTAIVEEEAELIRNAAERIIAGTASLEAICRDWNGAAQPTTTGAKWRCRGMKLLMTSPSLSGQILHPDGSLTKWKPDDRPAILSPEQGERLRAVIAGRSFERGAACTRLLSGIAHCGRCGGSMLAGTAARNKLRAYRCLRRAGWPNCGHMVISGDPLDRLIVEAVIYRLATPAVREALRRRTVGVEVDGIEAEVRADEETLVELSSDFYTRKLITREEFFKNRDAIKARLDANKRKLRRRRSPVDDLPEEPEALFAFWEKATIEARREVVRALIDRIVVNPGRLGARQLEAERLEVEWKA